MSGITTHVLDTSLGRPASGVAVHLERERENQWESVGRAETDAEGRVRTLVPEGMRVSPGVYRLSFGVREYFQRSDVFTFYPYVQIAFETTANQHYHVPLLISPFGYSKYRGS